MDGSGAIGTTARYDIRGAVRLAVQLTRERDAGAYTVDEIAADVIAIFEAVQSLRASMPLGTRRNALPLADLAHVARRYGATVVTNSPSSKRPRAGLQFTSGAAYPAGGRYGYRLL